MSNEEILDLVSQDDCIIGTMERDSIYAKGLRNFRVVNAFIINQQGQLWIPTRHPSKKLFPLCLDCSIGGHVKSQESYYDAFIRESIEETNIDPLKQRHELLGTLNPHANSTSSFMHVYAIYYDEAVNFNGDDFVEFKWVFPSELKALLEEGMPTKGDLKTIVESFF